MKRSKPQTTRVAAPESKLVRIEKPIYGGAFLARSEGKAIFVPLTLPGEEVRVRITQDKRGYSTAEAEEIVASAPERVIPECGHFGACGGCQYQHMDYKTQLTLKEAILRETLERGGVRAPEKIEVLAGEPWAYRNRIRLAFDAAGNPGYRGRRSHAVIPITECPIAAPVLLRAAAAAAELKRQVAPTIEMTEISLFCNADESALLASVYVARAEQAGFDGFAKALSERIPALRGVELLLEAREGQWPTQIARWGEECLTYRAGGFDFRVDHGAFFQVNRWLVDTLVERVAGGRKGKLAWDLFAGVGLFARNLAGGFERVVAVESGPMAMTALEQNLKGTSGAGVGAESLAFLRRQNTGKRPDLVVVDPPRTGLGAETTALLADMGAPAMVYVSCDPATLARDLRVLIGSGYSIEAVTLADLFPQTFHLETVVQLHRP